MSFTSQKNTTHTSTSPFHAGEQAIQSHLGVREQMEKFGARVIRDYMPEQHREFYSQLPFLMLGHCDSKGWPWASIVTGAPGFVSSDSDKQLRIATRPLAGDPLAGSLAPNLAVGVLGIEPHSRRRNRLSTVVAGSELSPAQNEFCLTVKQSFGNCPQYIQARVFEPVTENKAHEPSAVPFTKLSDTAVSLIRSSDTFYVASCSGKEEGAELDSSGTDVSHRGGRPGFIDVDSSGALTIPDFLGNNHFNTLGNFQVYPRAGLLFLDDETQDVLMLTGTVEILWDHDMQAHFEGAQRFWRFELSHGIWLKNALNLKTTFRGYSPVSLSTGDWHSAIQNKKAAAQKSQWRAFRLSRKEQESSAISSFYLRPESGALERFKAGQFVTLQVLIDDKPVVRTYTVSNGPGSDHYRISVKREESGLVSRYLHDELQIGQRVMLKAPLGQFTYDPKGVRPAVMLVAGIGITPAISMLQESLYERTKRGHSRPVIVVATVRSEKERAFASELNEIEKLSGGNIRVIWSMTSPEAHLVAGEDYQHSGRLSAGLLQRFLPIDDYEFYLCGPDGFMQSTYDLLAELGVVDHKIKAEAFGPASLRRVIGSEVAVDRDKHVTAQAAVAIGNAKGEVQAEDQWTDKDGSLLDFAEAHGLQPDYGCRAGSCGACAAKLVGGSVVYEHEPSVNVPDGSVLLCCAKPAAESDQTIATLQLQLLR